MQAITPQPRYLIPVPYFSEDFTCCLICSEIFYILFTVLVGKGRVELPSRNYQFLVLTVKLHPNRLNYSPVMWT